VEVALFGIPHNLGVVATCEECLKKLAKKGLDEKFVKEHPKEAEDIIKWAGEERIE